MGAAFGRIEVGHDIDLVPEHQGDQRVAHLPVANQMRERVDAGFRQRDGVVVVEDVRRGLEPVLVRFVDGVLMILISPVLGSSRALDQAAMPLFGNQKPRQEGRAWRFETLNRTSPAVSRLNYSNRRLENKCCLIKAHAITRDRTI